MTPYDWAIEMPAPHRRYGMTRPWFLILLMAAIGLSVLAAVSGVALLVWAAWSLGGVLVGAGFLTFDAKARKNGR